MKKIIVFALLTLVAIAPSVAQYPFSMPSYGSTSSASDQKASITFSNRSNYTMVLKIIYKNGGLYGTVTLPEYSSRVVKFASTNTFKLKIKAITSGGHVSYHDGGKFSVTCNSYEWTEGEMSFQMSSYGSGLGPSISAKEFESNY